MTRTAVLALDMKNNTLERRCAGRGHVLMI
jgi:hypothetical protein